MNLFWPEKGRALSKIMQFLPLRKRIAFGYILTILIFLFVAAISFFTNQQTVDTFNDFSQFSDQALKDSRFTKTIVELELVANRYIHEGHDSAADEVFMLYERLQQMLADRSQRNLDQPIQVKIRLIASHLDHYLDAFKQARKQRQLQTELVQVKLAGMAAGMKAMLSLFEEHPDATKNRSVTPLQASSLKNRLLMIELNGQRYFDILDAKYVKQVRQHFNDMRAMPFTVMHPELLQQVNTYERLFLEAVQRTRGYLYLLNVVMSADTYEMLYQSNQIAAILKTNTQQTEANIFASIHNQMLALTITTLVLLLLMAALSYLVVTSITTPLSQVQSIFKKMTQGSHEEVAIDYRQDDEISHLIEAARVFRSKNIDMQALLDKHTLLNETLESQVLARTQALAESQKKAEAAAKAKSQFLMMMSHEIRTPINAIMGMNHLALQTDLTARQRDYLEKAHKGAQSLLVIVNDILDFSKIEAGKLDIEEAAFNLEDVLDNLANMLFLEADQKGLDISFDIHQGTPLHLNGDALRLGQVLLNLVSNAIKFTESGEVLIEIEPCQEAGRDGKTRLQLIVADTGIGLSQTQIGQLFKSFSQADITTTRKYGGTGLGLAISKQLVQLMNGDIRVESEPGKGSRFIFTAAFGLQDDVQKNAFHLPDALAGMRVLVVEHSKTASRILNKYLHGWSILADSAASEGEALALLAKADKTYQLILIDWQGNNLDGLAITRRIRTLTHVSNIPVVAMLTPYHDDIVMKQAQDAGVAHFLSKPVRPSALFDSICSTLGHPVTVRRQPEGNVEAKSLADRAKHIQGARVLLVEDNTINQQIARELLEQAGLVVNIANNGSEAVSMVYQYPFDIVLMDLQMPVMDGYEATSRIRMDPRFSELPIIAMSAHVMAEDKAKCFSAGMSGHTPKPIDLNRLFTLLQCWIKPGVREQQLATPTLNNSAERLPDMPGIDLAALRNLVGENEGLIRELLVEFAAQFSSTTGQIRTLLDQGEIAQAKQVVHCIKGSAGNLSMTCLYQAAVRLECALRQDDVHQSDVLAEFEAQLNDMLESITPSRLGLTHALASSNV